MIKEGIRLNPIPAAIYYYSLSISYSLAGQYEEAIAAGKKAIRVNPKDPYGHSYLAIAYSLSGRQEEARIEI
jgi:Flp pilus assembly protein TadD